MQYSTDAPAVQQLPETLPMPNARRYASGMAVMGLIPSTGLPVAIREVQAIGQPGSFLTRRFQGVGVKVRAIPQSAAKRFAARLLPLN
jgi:hypothetical protein